MFDFAACVAGKGLAAGDGRSSDSRGKLPNKFENKSSCDYSYLTLSVTWFLKCSWLNDDGLLYGVLGPSFPLSTKYLLDVGVSQK